MIGYIETHRGLHALKTIWAEQWAYQCWVQTSILQELVQEIVPLDPQSIKAWHPSCIKYTGPKGYHRIEINKKVYNIRDGFHMKFAQNNTATDYDLADKFINPKG